MDQTLIRSHHGAVIHNVALRSAVRTDRAHKFDPKNFPGPFHLLAKLISLILKTTADTAGSRYVCVCVYLFYQAIQLSSPTHKKSFVCDEFVVRRMIDPFLFKRI